MAPISVITIDTTDAKIGRSMKKREIMASETYGFVFSELPRPICQSALVGCSVAAGGAAFPASAALDCAAADFSSAAPFFIPADFSDFAPVVGLSALSSAVVAAPSVGIGS